MTFQMSPKAIATEELMEAQSLCANLRNDVEGVIEMLRQNEKLDHDNDKKRREVHKHLLAAVQAFNMKDHTDVNSHVHSALQKLYDQEQTDLQDDRPRIDALIKLSSFSARLERSERRTRELLEKLKADNNTDQPLPGSIRMVK